MFSKKTMVIAGAILLIGLNIIVFSFNYLRRPSIKDAGVRTVLFFVSPVQEVFTKVISFTDGVWEHYFDLVNTAQEDVSLRRRLAVAESRVHRSMEIEHTNQRLRKFLDFKAASPLKFLPAEVVGKDPSPWYRSIVINKGTADGVKAGLPVVVPEGLVGHVVNASLSFSKVLLIVDQNSGVDALVQRTRARGVVSGLSNWKCRFDYALRKDDIRVGDTIITSGFDGVYPKGLRIGSVSAVVRRNSGIFQSVEIVPFVDFRKLEEVLVVTNPPVVNLTGK